MKVSTLAREWNAQYEAGANQVSGEEMHAIYDALTCELSPDENVEIDLDKLVWLHKIVRKEVSDFLNDAFIGLYSVLIQKGN